MNRWGGWSRKGFGKILTLMASVLLTLVVLEGILRITWPQVFLPHPPGMYKLDPSIGYMLTPDFEGEFRGAEFRVRVHTDGAGRRRTGSGSPDKDSFSILCLGDSFAWGWGVEDDEAYPAVLARILRDRRPDLDVRVLNAGVPGYGTDEQLAYLREWGAEIAPRIVIVPFFSGNDFDDNRILATRNTEIRGSMLYRIPAGEPARAPVWLRGVEWLKQRSHLIHLVSNRVGYAAMRLGLLDDWERPLSVYFTEEDAQRATELLVAVEEQAERLGARTLFVFLPDKMQVFSRPVDPLPAEAPVREAARISGAPFVDLTPELVARTDLEELYFLQDAHWTPKGHAWVARVLSKELADSGLIP